MPQAFIFLCGVIGFALLQALYNHLVGNHSAPPPIIITNLVLAAVSLYGYAKEIAQFLTINHFIMKKIIAIVFLQFALIAANAQDMSNVYRLVEEVTLKDGISQEEYEEFEEKKPFGRL